MMNKIRRTLCQSLSALFGLIGISACSQPAPQKPPPAHTEEENQRLHKYRGVSGYVLTVELFPKRPVSSRGLYCKIVDQQGAYVAGGIGIETSRGGMPPVSIHATLHDDTDANWKDRQPVLIGQWTVPVADRIPDDLLDDLRRDPRGNLRIKIRLHREGVLLGWDIERRPNPRGFTAKEIRDQNIGLAGAYSFVGGDFKEARPAHYVWENGAFNALPSALATPLNASDEAMVKKYNLMLVQGEIRTSPPTPSNFRRFWEKGWYIHPRTKERIETDF